MINTNEPIDSERFCVFKCGEDWFGLPALSVRSVVPKPQITKTPHSDPILLGICHLQNEFIPVFSLRALTRVQYESASDTSAQMLVMLGPHGSWGMLIDEAVALASLETSVSAFSHRDDNWSKITVGSATFRNQVLQIIDPQSLFEYTIHLLEMFWQDQNSPALAPQPTF